MPGCLWAGQCDGQACASITPTSTQNLRAAWVPRWPARCRCWGKALPQPQGQVHHGGSVDSCCQSRDHHAPESRLGSCSAVRTEGGQDVGDGDLWRQVLRLHHCVPLGGCVGGAGTAGHGLQVRALGSRGKERGCGGHRVPVAPGPLPLSMDPGCLNTDSLPLPLCTLSPCSSGWVQVQGPLLRGLPANYSPLQTEAWGRVPPVWPMSHTVGRVSGVGVGATPASSADAGTCKGREEISPTFGLPAPGRGRGLPRRRLGEGGGGGF